jgi:hypothetical protein
MHDGVRSRSCLAERIRVELIAAHWCRAEGANGGIVYFTAREGTDGVSGSAQLRDGSATKDTGCASDEQSCHCDLLFQSTKLTTSTRLIFC